MRKSKKRIGVSKQTPKIKLVPIETHFNPVVSGVLHRETPNYPSLTTNSGSTTKTERNVYTGNSMIGIGTLHKSNAVPIFKKEDMEDQAKMRR